MTLQIKLQVMRIQAEENNDIKIYYEIGRYYELGLGIPVSKELAAQYYEHAFANKGADRLLEMAQDKDTLAQFIVGRMYHMGQGGFIKNMQKAINYYVQSAQENSDAQNILGVLFQKGEGVVKDPAQANYYYQLAADKENAQAQFNLAVLYETGNGVAEINCNTALRYYTRSADQGYAPAQGRLGHIYALGLWKVNQDYGVAIELFQQAADQGNTDAQYNLSIFYECKTSGNVELSRKLSADWCQKAAEQNHIQAQRRLGDQYKKGFGLDKSDKQAKHWYKKSAQQNNAKAYQALGKLYLIGDNKNEIKALHYYQKAVKLNHAPSQVKLKNLLHEMIKNKNLQLFKFCCTKKFFIDWKDNEDNTLLHLSIISSNWEFAIRLILECVNKNKKNAKGESAFDLLAKIEEKDFCDEKKRLLAHIICYKIEDLAHNNFSEKFISEIREIAEPLQMNNSLVTLLLLSDIIIKNIDRNNSNKFILTDFNLALKRILNIKKLVPLVTLIAYATLGFHSLKDENSSIKLQITIEPEHETTEKTRCTANTSQANGASKKPTIQPEIIMARITQFVATIVSNDDGKLYNDGKPYLENNNKNKNQLNELHAQLYPSKDKLDECLQDALTSPIDEWPLKCVAAVAQMIATPGSVTKINQQCPSLFKYFNNTFLSACLYYLQDIRYKHDIPRHPFSAATNSFIPSCLTSSNLFYYNDSSSSSTLPCHVEKSPLNRSSNSM